MNENFYAGQDSDTLNFSAWIDSTECFGKDDIDNVEDAYVALTDEFDSIFGGDFDAEYNVEEEDGNVVIRILNGGKKQLVDILRNLWEDQLNKPCKLDMYNIVMDMIKNKD